MGVWWREADGSNEIHDLMMVMTIVRAVGCIHIEARYCFLYVQTQSTSSMTLVRRYTSFDT